MTLERRDVRTITFDSYSTLVDPRSAGSVLDEYVDDPEAVANQWHSLAVRYATVANDVDAYRTYYDLHADALAYLLDARGYQVGDDEIEDLTDVYYDLEPFDDVTPTLERLHEAGYDLAILSNGDPDLLDSLVETTNTEDLLTTTISADEIRTFKPESALYELAGRRLGTSVDEILHVGAGWGDIMGCMHAGMQGAWVNRRGNPWPRFDGKPDLVVDSLEHLANVMLVN